MSDLLPLEAHVTRTNENVVVELPVRSEEIHLEKRVVVGERVFLRQHAQQATVRLRATLQREVPRVEVHGDVDMP